MNDPHTANHSLLSQALSGSPLYPFSSPISSHKLAHKEKPYVPEIQSIHTVMREHITL